MPRLFPLAPYSEHRHHPFLPALFAVVLALLAVAVDQLFLAAVILRAVALVLAVVFTVRYSKRPWKQTAEGHHLMAFTIIVAAFLAYASVNNLVAYIDPTQPVADGPYHGRQVIGVLLYAAVAWELWQRNRLLTLASREQIRERTRV